MISHSRLITLGSADNTRESEFVRRAVFLDRDGTINEDPGYINDPKLLRLLPGAGQGIRYLNEQGFEVIVISNQSGVARGLITPEQLLKVHSRLEQLLKECGAKIDHFYLCTHHPDELCSCRKPSPFLLLQAAHDLSLDLKGSYMVGDKMSDVEAGLRAQLRSSMLVRTGDGGRSEKAVIRDWPNTRVFSHLEEASRWIVSDSQS